MKGRSGFCKMRARRGQERARAKRSAILSASRLHVYPNAPPPWAVRGVLENHFPGVQRRSCRHCRAARIGCPRTTEMAAAIFWPAIFWPGFRRRELLRAHRLLIHGDPKARMWTEVLDLNRRSGFRETAFVVTGLVWVVIAAWQLHSLNAVPEGDARRSALWGAAALVVVALCNFRFARETQSTAGSGT
jgi:hypothetical protein